MTQAKRQKKPEPAKNISVSVTQTTSTIEAGGSQVGVPIKDSLASFMPNGDHVPDVSWFLA